jgi:lysozyme
MSELVDLLKQHEGVRLRVYDDATGLPIGPGSVVQGHPTIGVGRALDVNGVSLDEAEYMVTNDIHSVQGILRRTYPWFSLMLAARQDAITDMAYNLGLPGFGDNPSFQKFTGAIAALEKGDYKAAAAHMLASKWATQVGKRAIDLSIMMETGAYL